MSTLKRKRSNEAGGGLVEYCLLLMLLTLIAFASSHALGNASITKLEEATAYIGGTQTTVPSDSDSDSADDGT